MSTESKIDYLKKTIKKPGIPFDDIPMLIDKFSTLQLDEKSILACNEALYEIMNSSEHDLHRLKAASHINLICFK